MKKFTLTASALVVALLAMIFIASPLISGQQERGECQKQCTEQFQACRRAANANKEHRIVYQVTGNKIRILACRYHY